MSLAIEIELLAGRYVATRHNDRGRAEWPPHPARLFSAAVAAWAEVPDPDGRRRDEERAVLRWLETLDAPTISCSLDRDVAHRTVATHFVPVNDASAVRDTSTVYARLIEARRSAEQAALDGASDGGRSTTTQLARARATAVATAESARARTLPSDAIAVLPDHRGRQPRTFPSVTPADPRIVFTWSAAQPTLEQRRLLDGLLARVGRLGHSSSLVSCRVVDDPPPATLEPHVDGALALRVPGPGQFDLLEDEHRRHQGIDPRSLPAAIRAYTRVARDRSAARPASLYTSRWLVLASDNASAPLSIRASLALARAVRAALVAHADDDAAELISGRDPTSGAPSRRCHLLVLPLPFVGHRHADGMIRGVALALPTAASAEDERALLAERGLLAAVRRWRSADGGVVDVGRRRVTLDAEQAIEPPVTLRSHTWCRESSIWATATPIALDRFPGDLRAHGSQHAQAEAHACETISRACGHVGLPRPVSVEVGFDGPLVAVPKVRAFPPFQTPNGGPRRALIHAHVQFAEPVEGPVVLGAGRFVGQGLCMPLDEHRDG